MKLVKWATSSPTTELNQLTVSTLIHEIRQLTQLTQVQLAATLGVSYETINRWENGHIQPSPLGLKQIRSFMDELSRSPFAILRSKQHQYFSGGR